MRRAVCILLLLAFAGVATGAIQSLHQAQHRKDAAAWAAALQAASGKHGPVPAPAPLSTSNCVICLALNLPLLSHSAPAAIAGLILLALATVRQPTQLLLQSLPLPIDCRGPPLR